MGVNKEDEEGDDEDDDDDDDDEEDEDEEEEDEDEEDGDDDNDYDVDICPPGCNVVIYTRMVIEREKRLDMEDIISAERKSLSIMSKDFDMYSKRFRVTNGQLKLAEEELIAYQVISV